MKRFFDLRFIIGLFFLLTGILLVAYSLLFTSSAVNQWSGGIYILFGAIMILLSTNRK